MSVAQEQMTRNEWLHARQRGIGGSDAAAVLGVSRWKTPLQVYLEKRGEVSVDDISGFAAVEWGNRLEPVIRQAYSDRTGESVIVPGRIIAHPTHDWMIGNLDGLTQSGKVLEIKTARSSEGWGEPGTDEVPAHYLVQVQHYMAITGAELADVAVLFGGSDLEIYSVPADPDLQSMMIDQEAAFWQSVQDGVPPQPRTMSDVRARWSTSASRSVVASIEVAGDITALADIRVQQAKLDTIADEIQTRICAAMGEADTLTNLAGKPMATWKTAKASDRLDTAALKAAHPDLIATYMRPGSPSRRFLLKTQAA
jgi:putative phage-type endonuclease